MAQQEKESSCNAGDTGDAGSIPGSIRSPGEGNGNPLQYSCLGNPMDRRAWWAIVHEVTKSKTWLSNWAHIYLWINVFMLLFLQRFWLWQWRKKLPNLPCADVVPKYWRSLWIHYACYGSLHQLSMICLLCKVSNLYRMYLFMPAIHLVLLILLGWQNKYIWKYQNRK